MSDTQAVRKMPAFPGAKAGGQPKQLGASARQMMGVPVTGVQPPTQAGGKEGVRPTGSK